MAFMQSCMKSSSSKHSWKRHKRFNKIAQERGNIEFDSMMQSYMGKTERELEQSVQGNVFLRLLKYALPYCGQMLLALLLVLAVTALDLYRPILTGEVIDIFSETADITQIADIAIQYLIVLILIFGFNFLQTWILQLTGQTIIYNIRQELFSHIHSLSMRFFDITPVGRLVTRVTNDVETLNEMYTQTLVRLIRNIAKIIGLAIVMLAMNVKLALLGFCLVPLIVLLTYFFKKISKTTYRIARTKLSALNTYLSEHLSGMKVIQIFAREKEKDMEFKERAEDLFRANYREMMVFAIFRPLMYILSVIALCIILSAGGYSVLEGSISIGTLYIFTNYIGSFFEPIQELAEQFSTLQSAMASAEKIFSVLDEKPLVQNPAQPKYIGKVSGKIEFEHVWFAYQEEDWILKDVSFTIEPGQKVAFVGATGAGKSSILNLIGRYYDIQRGRITIDGIDIKELSTDELRAAIGQVQQDVFIFTGDINSNIRLKNEKITDEEIKAAARYVNADHFIEQLEHSYEEYVTERGTTLSAGQRQLISFARTLAYDPAILVMDEATANIDTETELLIQDALERLMEGRTTIMVAHRLSTIQHADKIMVMHKGELRECGTHQELLSQDGIYKKLYELQLASA